MPHLVRLHTVHQVEAMGRRSRQNVCMRSLASVVWTGRERRQAVLDVLSLEVYFTVQVVCRAGERPACSMLLGVYFIRMFKHGERCHLGKEYPFDCSIRCCLKKLGVEVEGRNLYHKHFLNNSPLACILIYCDVDFTGVFVCLI